jgi:transmembrane sensor
MTRRAFAGAALAASVGGAIYLGVRPLLSSETIETARGQRTQQQLGDGSSIALNTDSKVEVALGKGERHVTLVRGEVFFDVRRDPDRPFVVDLGDARVEVLGTSFNILKKNDMIEVTVSEGVVAVTGFDGAVTQVQAGKTALVGQGLLTTSATSEALARQRRAWNEGFIELNDEPLVMAVTEVNRYRTVPLVIGDPSIASLTVSGRFGVNESDSFIDALKTSFDLKTVRTPAGTIILMRESDEVSNN